MTKGVVVSEQLMGQALLEQGLLTEAQLNQALLAQPKQKQRVGELAVSLGFVKEPELTKFLADFFRVPYVALSDEEELDLAAVELVPELLARRYQLIALKKADDTLTVAMADPLDVRALDAVRLETGCRIHKVIASREAILVTKHGHLAGFYRNIPLFWSKHP